MTETPVSRLINACNEAYDRFTKYCNQSTHHVITTVVDPDWPLELADPMIDRIVSSNWQEVDDQTAAQLANQGIVVVAGLRGGANGHVVVVYPGEPKPQGGFDCYGKHYPEIGGPYPRSMSTSVSTWCGTRSRGDKTIRDAWSAADWPNVKRWRQR
jgi:hypothetical protein